MSDNTEHRTKRERISIANQVYASYPLFKQVLDDIDSCHDSPNIKGDDDPDCLLLTGTTGAGKTTIYKTYAQNYPIRETEEGIVVPIIYAKIPSAATVKGLVKVLLKAIGDPLYSKGTTIDQTDRLYGLLNNCQVELIFLDEFHHFIDSDSNKVLKNVCNWLKTLILETKIPIVLFGKEESKNILTVENDNLHLSRRFNYRHSLVPFPLTESKAEAEAEAEAESKTVASPESFRRFLSDIESKLPLSMKSDLAEESLADRIYYATDGTIAHVMTLIRKGATLAIDRDLDRLDIGILGVIYDKHLKHDKLFKKTDPFLKGNNFDLEAAYAMDLNSSNSKKSKKATAREINDMLRASS
jgi:Bacterial TniB protein